MSGRETVPRVTKSLSAWHFLPILAPFLPLTRPSLEPGERRTESHPGGSSVPAEVFLPACKLGWGWGRRGSVGRAGARGWGPAVRALCGKGAGSGKDRAGGAGAETLQAPHPLPWGWGWE